MKKLIKKIIGIILLLFLLQFVVNILIKKHTTDYKIIVGKNKYTITETFEVKNKQHHYLIEVKGKNKKTFHFRILKNYNKTKQIITDIIELTKDDITCIYPILKESESSYLSCTDTKNEFSYEILKKDYKNIAEEFAKKLKEKKIILDKEESKEEYKDVTYYKENLEDRIITLWNYHELFYLKEKTVKTIPLFKNDQYKNEHSITVGDKYIIMNTDQVHDFNEIYIINLKNGTKKTWKLKQKISTDSYFLGVVDNKVYLFDKDNLIEYELDPNKKSIKIVGDVNKNGMYYNGKWHKKNIYEFKKQNIVFPNTTNVDKIEEKYSDAMIYDTETAYYFIHNNNLYIRYKQFDSDKLLLKDISFKEIIILDNDFYFIDKDTIYCYDKNESLKRLVTYRELQFNNYHAYTINKN